MMKKYFELVILSSALLLLNAMIASATVITYTGDVGTDFGPYPTTEVYDPIGDVGMPLYAPPGDISGWEIERIVFYLSLDSNVLQVGLDAVGIAGDVDGNGIDGNSPQWLLDNGGIDYPDLMNSESMGIAFDFDQDGNYDFIAGVPAFNNLHKVCEFSGFPALPFMAFGTERAEYDGGRFYNGLAGSPDYELTITTLDELLIWTGDLACFNFLAFGGSFEDDGVGEEYVFGTVCLEDNTLTEVAVPQKIELNAYPNPFNPSTTLNFSLVEAGPVNLNIYNLAGQLVSTLVDADLPVGEYNYSFNANDLPSGLYIAQINTTQASYATRLVLLK
ncbi:T9SS type A sorting domain-containing protein [bacterium]|nr:T9SS type A sorting domain-containing protein [bacterium]